MGQFFGVIFVDHESGLTEMEQVSKSISKFIESCPDYYLGSPAGQHYRVNTPLDLKRLRIMYYDMTENTWRRHQCQMHE